MQKGQISIEYLLIISLMLLYITVIILPNVDVSSKATKEIAGMSQARTAAEKIVNTANEVALSGETARQTITVYAPVGAEIHCESNPPGPAAISFRYDFGDPNDPEEPIILPRVDACINDGENDDEDEQNNDPDGQFCFKRFKMLSSYNISCAETFPMYGGEQGKLTTIIIEKTNPTELTITANP